MQVENRILNWNIASRTFSNVTNKVFIWYKYIDGNTDEQPLSNYEADLLIEWFNNYPQIFTNNIKQQFVSRPFQMPILRPITGVIPKFIIKSDEIRIHPNRFTPRVNYNLEFDVIGYEI